VDGGNLLARYNHHFTNSSNLTFQAYYDLTNREMFIGKLKEETIDIDLQHRFSLSKRQEVILGLGYRHVNHDISLADQDVVSFGDRRLDLFSGFLQDEISLVPERLTLIVGTKCEDNDFTGFEIQPNARLLWTPNDTTTLWTAVSRAVRTPNRGNHDTTFTLAAIPPNPANPLPTIVKFEGNDSLDSEDLLAWEAGCRMQVRENLSFDLALFYNLYDGITGDGRTTTSMTFPTVTVTVNPTNKFDATTYGAELVIDWLPFDWWHLQFTGSCEDMDFDPNKDDEGRTPDYQFSVRSMVDLPHNLEFDLWLRTVDKLPADDISNYIQLDLRLGWQPLKNLELALIGQNLLDRQQPEFVDSMFYFNNTEVERSFYLKATLEF
jgi:iron complex outermembrane receptor protein